METKQIGNKVEDVPMQWSVCCIHPSKRKISQNRNAILETCIEAG